MTKVQISVDGKGLPPCRVPADPAVRRCVCVQTAVTNSCIIVRAVETTDTCSWHSVQSTVDSTARTASSRRPMPLPFPTQELRSKLLPSLPPPHTPAAEGFSTSLMSELILHVPSTVCSAQARTVRTPNRAWAQSQRLWSNRNACSLGGSSSSPHLYWRPA